MSVVEYIGNEVSAAAYRLCGVTVHVAHKNTASMLINNAINQASLVLIGSSITPYLSSTELDALMASVNPHVLVVPDVHSIHAVPDIGTRIHKQLGILE